MTAPAKTSPAKPKADEVKQAAEICDCTWPDGWPEDAESASCVHGTWSRTSK